MGVKDLNTLMKIKGMEVKKDKFDIVIFDGSFLLINTLTSVYKKLTDENKLNLTKFGTINQNLLYQMKYIIDNSIKQIVNCINSFDKRFKPEKIYFVTDPKNKINYKIDETLEIPEKFREFLLKEVENDKELEKVKLQEQELRKQRASKIDDIKKKCNEISDTIMSNIYRQSNHFSEMTSLTHLLQIINNYLAIKWRNSNINFIQSIDEADLVIKNIGEKETSENKEVLVISADTDYFILFSNNDKVWITLNQPYLPIYHPVTQWKYILTDQIHDELLIEPEKIYDYAIRFAALFGNDYHIITLISAKDPTFTICKRLVAPLAMNDAYGELNKHTNAYKLYISEIELYKKCIEPITYDDLDVIVQSYMSKNCRYDFRKYLISTVIYKNWGRFNKYKIFQPNNEPKEIEKNVLRNLLHIQQVNNENGENTEEYLINHRCYEKFYDWEIDDDTEIINIKELPANIDELYLLYKRDEEEEVAPNFEINIDEL